MRARRDPRCGGSSQGDPSSQAVRPRDAYCRRRPAAARRRLWHDVQALADLAGPSGLVVGVEPSQVLLAEAHRPVNSALPVHLVAGDAHDLPLHKGVNDMKRGSRDRDTIFGLS